jgi:hypothetical protein
MPSVTKESLEAAGVELPPGVSPPPAASEAAPPQRQIQKTMLGMTGPLPGAPPSPSESAHDHAQPEKAMAATTQRTMLGMPAAEMLAAQAAAAEAQAKAAAAKPSEPAVPSPTTNRTMLGMAVTPPPQAAEAPAPKGASWGTPAAVPPDVQARPRAAVQYGEAIDPESIPPPAPRAKSRVPLVLGLLFALVLVLGAGGLAIALVLGTGGGRELRASVVNTEEGEGLRVELPDAEAGTRVRFAGEERVLENDVTTFALRPDALHLGDNQLTVEVLAPGGEPEPRAVTLTVSFRIRPNLAGLADEQPAIGIAVDALAGSRVTVDGEAVALDASGHGERRIAVEASAGSEPGAAATVFEHSVPYRVELPGGETREGTLRTRIPFTSLQIDRPGLEAVTDRDAIEIAGAAHPGAVVAIDGEAVEIVEGRFVHRLALPEPGERTVRVVARRDGRAPNAITLRIRRVVDLAAEAATFEADASLTYARIQQNPTIYRGQRVAMEGRVYNVGIHGGHSILQILVRDCPRGERCPLWVTLPQATDVENQSWVRVLGVIGGEQQFRSESDRVITVPRVDAHYVLPLER